MDYDYPLYLSDCIFATQFRPDLIQTKYISKTAFSFFFCIVIFSISGFAQIKQVQHLQQIWVSYFNQSRLTKKWGIWDELQVKTQNNFTNRFSNTEATIGAIYHLTNNIKLVDGYTLVTIYPSDGKTMNSFEHRSWQMIQLTTLKPKIKFTQWLRLEERFKSQIIDNNTLGKGFDFSCRTRYNIFMQIPLGKKKYAPGHFSILTANELFLNIGGNTPLNTFDQDRFFIGTFYHVNKHDNIQIGFTKVYQQMANKSNFKSLDVIKLTYFNNLDFNVNKH